MAPTIRVDDEVWEWLKRHATPLEDTPNSVLRRLAGLDTTPSSPAPEAPAPGVVAKPGPARDLLSVFQEVVEEAGKSRGLRVRTWLGGHRRSANLIELADDQRSTVLYVKTRSDSGGFWGLNKNHVRSLEQGRWPWFAIFLIGPGEKGYLLNSEQVLTAIKHERWSFGQAGDYKIHEGPELAGFPNFNKHSDLVHAVLELVWRAT